jgi:hypothetical protein
LLGLPEVLGLLGMLLLLLLLVCWRRHLTVL